MNLNGFEITGMEDSNSTTFQKYFTAAEANAALPLVRRIVRDIVEQYRLIVEHDEKCQDMSLSEQQRAQAETARAQATDKLNTLAGELSELGCELKDWECGLVDFPARLDNRDVYLCWKLGEEQITEWHELHAGFTGRERIAGDLHFGS